MTKKFVIRKMTTTEVAIAIQWAKQEGWNPGLNDATCFYQADPNGFFIGLLNDEPIAMGSAVIYDEHFAFCGLYIVKKDFRDKGYGIELTNARLNYVGNRITGIDGVLNMVGKYEQHLSYVPAYKNCRYQLDTPISTTVDSRIIELNKIPLNQLLTFDRKYFPAPRSNFLQVWINQPGGIALGFLEEEKLLGYGVARPCYEGFKIGPLFAKKKAIAQAIFSALCFKAQQGPFFLDIPLVNTSAIALVQENNMRSVFEAIRMYRNGTPKIDINGVYGITTFELG